MSNKTIMRRASVSMEQCSDYSTIAAQLCRVVNCGRIPIPSIKSSAEFISAFDGLTQSLIIQLVASFPAVLKETISIKYPRNWWEALKERFAPEWFKRAYPVDYFHIEQSLYGDVYLDVDLADLGPSWVDSVYTRRSVSRDCDAHSGLTKLMYSMDLNAVIRLYPDLEKPYSPDNNPIARYLSHQMNQRVFTSYRCANIQAVCSVRLRSDVVEYLESEGVK